MMSIVLPTDDLSPENAEEYWPLYSLVETLEIQLLSSFKGILTGMALAVTGFVACAGFSIFNIAVGAILGAFAIISGLTYSAGCAYLHKLTLDKLGSLRA
jgi:hypothetical protein